MGFSHDKKGGTTRTGEGGGEACYTYIIYIYDPGTALRLGGSEKRRAKTITGKKKEEEKKENMKHKQLCLHQLYSSYTSKYIYTSIKVIQNRIPTSYEQQHLFRDVVQPSPPHRRSLYAR